MKKAKSKARRATSAKPRAPAKRASLSALPKIGANWNGGMYAGLSVHDEKPVALVLLQEELESGTWDEAVAWAEKQNAALPSRIDQLVLLKNLKSSFQPAWYWSGAPYAGDESYAWCQHFYNGDQYYDHKYYKLRARAVRRVAI